jgi:methionyl-tRNA formyltransferase
MVDQPLRVVFCGTPQFAVPTLTHLLASRHTVCGIVTRPDRPRGRGQKVRDAPIKAMALTHGLPVIQPARPRDPDVASTLRAWSPDLGVVAAYGSLIPENLLAVPPFGMINVHPSMLPKYRGAAPVHRAVIDGVTDTGVTIMRVATLLDSGNMLATAPRAIGPDETSDVVERDLSEMGAALLMAVLEQIVAGTVQDERQDDMLATYAARLTKAEGLVDWTLPAGYIHNRVRGLYPWPHAYSYLDAARLILLATRVEERPAEAEPGTIVDVSRDAIEVATGHRGRIAILSVQPEGRRAMPTRDFLSGHVVTAGARFTVR